MSILVNHLLLLCVLLCLFLFSIKSVSIGDTTSFTYTSWIYLFSVEYAVVEKPTLKTIMQGGLDHIMLKNLNIDGIRTIGSVLGQSIALDYYVRQVCVCS